MWLCPALDADTINMYSVLSLAWYLCSLFSCLYEEVNIDYRRQPTIFPSRIPPFVELGVAPLHLLCVVPTSKNRKPPYSFQELQHMAGGSLENRKHNTDGC